MSHYTGCGKCHVNRKAEQSVKSPYVGNLHYNLRIEHAVINPSFRNNPYKDTFNPNIIISGPCFKAAKSFDNTPVDTLSTDSPYKICFYRQEDPPVTL